MDSKHILIIDDDLELCEELTDLLESEGFSVRCATDGVLGEELIKNNSYNTIILDYKMPKHSGIDILKKLKAEGIKKKIILFTGRPHVEKQLKDEGLLDMVSALLEKPVNFAKLLVKVRLP